MLQVIRERSAEFNDVMTSDDGLASVGDEYPPGALGGRNRLAFLDMLLYESKRGANLDFLDIREEVDTFMFEVALVDTFMFEVALVDTFMFEVALVDIFKFVVVLADTLMFAVSFCLRRRTAALDDFQFSLHAFVCMRMSFFALL